MSVEGVTPEEEAVIASRIMEWFDVLIKLRRAADAVPAQAIVDQLKRANPAMLDGTRVWLELMLYERFRHEGAALERLETLAANRPPERFTVEQYTQAKANARTRKELASMLDITPQGLRLWEIRHHIDE